MSDLVERLRKEAMDAIDWDGERWLKALSEHMTEAADRIEALEAALREIVKVSNDEWVLDSVIRIARAALAPEQDK